MAVPNTLLLEKGAVVDWDEWNSLPESKTQQFYFSQKKRISRKKK